MSQSFLPRAICAAALVFVLCPLITAQAPAAADPTTAALRAALAKGASHAREWLEQKDFKSLAQSAGGLQLLAQLLMARSDDVAWQTAVGKVAAAIGEVQATARTEHAAKATEAIATLERTVTAAQAVSPTGKPQELPRGPAIRSLMLTMDGLYADAKIATIAGDVAAAKNQARVLAELGKLVSNSRSGEAWSKLAGDFSQAAITAADSPETDPKTFRPILRGISQRCEACHEMRGR